MTQTTKWLTLFTAVLLCLTALLPFTTVTAEAAGMAREGKFLSGGYYYGSYDTDIDSLNLADLDYVVYAFVKPYGDGNFRPMVGNEEENLIALVEKAHAQGIKVLLGIGGGSTAADFDQAVASEGGIIKFVKSTMAYMEKYNLDGVDLDWESPLPGESSENCEKLVMALRDALKEENLYFTAAMAGVYSPTSGNAHTNAWSDATLECFDWIHIMTYSSEKQNSPLWFPDYSLNYWHEVRGIPEEKLLVGLPLFGMTSWKTYADLVAVDANNAYLDFLPASGEEAESNYNGINMVREKIKMAYERGGGVFTWVINWDSPETNYNLTKVIRNTINEVEEMGIEEYVDKVTVIYNNREILFTESTGYPFVDSNGRTMVPARQSGETLGMTIDFVIGELDEETETRSQTAIAKGNNLTIEIPIGEAYIVVNGQQQAIDTEAVVINGRSYLPLRAFFEAAGCTFEEWHNNTKTAYITK